MGHQVSHDAPDAGARVEGLRERKKREAGRQIRDVALALFIEHGYEAVSIEQIAAVADVSRTTFFNYYSSKEAVITDPDPGVIAHQRALCSERPDGEPLWDSLESLMLDGLADVEVAITAQKHLTTTSPALMHIRRSVAETMVNNLRDWAESRVDPTRRPQALLQLNVMVAAVSTAFMQWDLDEPYDTFVQLAKTHMQQLRRSFGPGTT